MLLPRLLTALIGAPLLLLSIWWGQIPFFVLVLGIVLLALQEYFSLTQEAGWPGSKILGMTLGALFTFAIAVFGTEMFGQVSAAKFANLAVPMWITFQVIFLAAAPLFFKRENKSQAFLNYAITFLGLFYVAWTMAHLILLRDLRPLGMEYTFFLFLVIWTVDIGAYVGGKQFGKHPLAKTISPKKTWEGAVSGSLLGLGTGFVLQHLLLRSIPMRQVLVLTMVIVVLSQISDLAESLFKRNVGVKDSGQLLPGHGGILDRFDSFLLTVPVFYYLLKIWVCP